jgi:hypothetical protein
MTIEDASSSDNENEVTQFSESDNEGAEDALQLSDDDCDFCSPPLQDIAITKRKKSTSWVWDHFKSNASDKTHAFCLLCSNSIYFGASRSTGMLECHMKRKHPKEHLEAIARETRLKSRSPSGGW